MIDEPNEATASENDMLFSSEQGSNPEPVPNPAPTLPENRRNQHLKVQEPKNKQFTGRATEREYNRISQAIAAKKARNPECADIVRLCLAMLNHIEADIFQTFKTK